MNLKSQNVPGTYCANFGWKWFPKIDIKILKDLKRKCEDIARIYSY